MNRRQRRDEFRRTQPRKVRMAVFGRWRTRHAGPDARWHI